MRIFFWANEMQKKELETLKINDTDELIFNSELPGKGEFRNYDACFFLSESWPSVDLGQFGTKPVFINEVTSTLTELNLPSNVSRLNAWPGFLQNKIWEVASNDQKNIETIFSAINHDFVLVKDGPGLVAARVISMIINEAFYALGEKVSAKEEIDMAMKLGTNYPRGPFEWAEKIGLNNIYNLLEKLSKKNDRYLVAPALKKMFSVD